MQAEQQKRERIINEMENRRETINVTAKNDDVISKKVILFMEDSKSGYEFMKLFIKRCYPLFKIDILSLDGYGNIKYIPDYLKSKDIIYDNVIIMYDRGRSSGNQINDTNRKGLTKVVNKLKKAYANMKIHLFSPLCFESIPLSFRFMLDVFLVNYNIPTSQYTKLHYELVDLLSNNIQSINWFTYVSMGMSVEKIIEQAIEEITRNTKYVISHNPSYISKCWTIDCDNRCQELDTKCNIFHLSDYHLVNQHKLELIAENSALGGFTYIMDKIYGIQGRSYPLAIASDSAYKPFLIQEV